MEKKKKEVKAKEKQPKLVEVLPLKDHKIKQNAFFYDLKKDKPQKVDERFLEALKTEKVIKG